MGDAFRPKKRLPAHVSPEAHAAWHAYAEKHGTTVSALAEAIGELAGHFQSLEEGDLPDEARVVIRRARQVASGRLRRGTTSGDGVGAPATP